MITIEKERFEAWLFNQPENRIINPADSTHCVFCSFARETIREPICCSWKNYSVVSTAEYGKLPDWAIQMVNPDWVMSLTIQRCGWTLDNCFSAYEVSIKDLQDRYIQLFGDPRAGTSPEPKPEPETVTVNLPVPQQYIPSLESCRYILDEANSHWWTATTTINTPAVIEQML